MASQVQVNKYEYLTEKILPAYPFVQYRDDPMLLRSLMHTMKLLRNTSIHSQSGIAMLDIRINNRAIAGLVALGIYGVERPLLQVSEEAIHAVHTIPLNTIRSRMRQCGIRSGAGIVCS